jgi:hypothetical protein
MGFHRGTTLRAVLVILGIMAAIMNVIIVVDTLAHVGKKTPTGITNDTDKAGEVGGPCHDWVEAYTHDGNVTEIWHCKHDGKAEPPW